MHVAIAYIAAVHRGRTPSPTSAPIIDFNDLYSCPNTSLIEVDNRWWCPTCSVNCRYAFPRRIATSLNTAIVESGRENTLASAALWHMAVCIGNEWVTPSYIVWYRHQHHPVMPSLYYYSCSSSSITVRLIMNSTAIIIMSTSTTFRLQLNANERIEHSEYNIVATLQSVHIRSHIIPHTHQPTAISYYLNQGCSFNARWIPIMLPMDLQYCSWSIHRIIVIRKHRLEVPSS